MTKTIDEAPDLTRIDDVVSSKITSAMRDASKQLTSLKIRHALIGGIAVGAYGYARATKDVDFIAGEEAFEIHGGGLLTFKPGVPLAIRGVAVDVLEADDVEAPDLDHPIMTEGIPVVTPEVLVYMKLRAHRRRDQEDIVQLLRGGHIDRRIVRKFIEEHDPDLLKRFDALDAFADEAE